MPRHNNANESFSIPLPVVVRSYHITHADKPLLDTGRPTQQVVTGATGRVGSLAVRRLLELYPQVLVRAVVNDYAKGCRLLEEDIDKYGIKLEVSRR